MPVVLPLLTYAAYALGATALISSITGCDTNDSSSSKDPQPEIHPEPKIKNLIKYDMSKARPLNAHWTYMSQRSPQAKSTAPSPGNNSSETKGDACDPLIKEAEEKYKQCLDKGTDRVTCENLLAVTLQNYYLLGDSFCEFVSKTNEQAKQ